MKNNIDKLLKTALTPTDIPPKELNDQVLWKIKERKNMSNRKKIPAAILATGVLLLGSVTAMAAYHYLSPAEVATELNDNTLTQAFLGEEAILVNETQEVGDYRITLLGCAAGKNISDSMTYINGIPKDDRIYTVIAIEHTDGTPMPSTSSDDYGKEPFYASYYIQGLDPYIYDIGSMGGGYSDFVKDGTQYRLLEMDNIEMFADKIIYVGVNSGTFYDDQAYHHDVKTGEITRNTNYEEANALFRLPIDPGKADPKAAEAYLEELYNTWHAPSDPVEKNEADLTVEEFMQKLTPENLDEYAAPVESTRMICPVDEEGILSYKYEFESGAAGSGKEKKEDFFPDGSTDTIHIGGYSYSDGLEDLTINVFLLNEDGTVTFVIYQPII